MRLLHSQALTFHDFFENATPPYAILSHTWQEEEVTYQDMKGQDAHKLVGFTKIRQCCKRAALEGLSFVWIDTCCIDKASSAELSEAINSMYHWYKNARICYAYLADVPTHEPFHVTAPKSRWFTRGWTLQELIAPTILDFYDQNWTRIGRREELSDIVSKITRIDHATLKGRSVLEVSVAKRMSWASARVTSRPEDIAYCLIGIFGVNLPLLYGEGDKAFVRLQEEIMKNSDDQSLFAWKFGTQVSKVLHDDGGIQICLHPPEDIKYPSISGRTRLSVYPRSLHGFLARSPAEFYLAGNVIPYRNWDHSVPYSMTNQGLQIQLPIVQLEATNDYIGILACHFEDNFLGPLGIYVHPVASPRADQFARDSSYPDPVIVPPDHVSKAVERTVYIRQQVLLPTAKDSDRKNYFLIRTLPGEDYELSHYYPQHYWNESQRIMRSPVNVGALVFRYNGDSYDKPPLPFAVGFRAKLPIHPGDDVRYSCSIVVDPHITDSEDLKAIAYHTATEAVQSQYANLSPWCYDNEERAFAKISQEVFMGQEMFVVDIAVVSTKLSKIPFF